MKTENQTGNLRMDEKDRTKLSRKMAFLLRHHPEAEGLDISKYGWVLTSQLASALNTPTSHLRRVVETDKKQRFELDQTGIYIRAAQGHSFPVDLGLEEVSPPSFLYHGTPRSNLSSILEFGIYSRGRNHVHLSLSIEEALNIGRRHSPDAVVLMVKSEVAHNRGTKFYQAPNGVWLSEVIKPQFIETIGEIEYE